MEVKKVDTKEFELPETVFVRDIENRVFQEIVFNCLTQIPGIAPVESSLLDNLLGRAEGIRGIQAEQDPKNHSVSIKCEVNILFGASIPEKAEVIQSMVAEQITTLTGLHVALVHVVFKALIHPESSKRVTEKAATAAVKTSKASYSDTF